MIYVGALHFQDISTLITKVPFEDITLVSLTLRRQDPDLFDKQIQLHTRICHNSWAIKLQLTTLGFREAIQSQARNESYVSNTRIDSAKASTTKTDCTIYIQCLERDKTALTEWVTTFIATYSNVYPGEDLPVLTQPIQTRWDGLVNHQPTN